MSVDPDEMLHLASHLVLQGLQNELNEPALDFGTCTYTISRVEYLICDIIFTSLFQYCGCGHIAVCIQLDDTVSIRSAYI